jgi:bleomycin hydrolase
MSSTDTKSVTGSVSAADLAEFSAALQNPKTQLAINTATRYDVRKISQSRAAHVEASNHTYSHKIPKEQKATSQKSSGRCWLFAATNVARVKFIKKHNLDAFEFSQGWLLFWDKFEKANYLLENIIATVDHAVESRLVSHLLTTPVQDGGQYCMFKNIFRKYGLVPKAAYPESFTSSCTRGLNWLLTYRLRGFAAELRTAHEAGKSVDELRALKKTMLAEVYRILATTLGEPPKTFDWTFVNKDKEFKSYKGLTALEFTKQHVPFDADDYVSLVHDPRNDLNKLYTVEYLGNQVGGGDVLYINTDLELMKELTRAEIADKGEPVWFGCDVGKFSDRELGAMSVELFDYENLFDIQFTLNKADRLRYGESLMTHAMVFTGVDVDPETKKVKKFRVENSWGEKGGDKGYFSMSSKWFDEYNYQVVLPKSSLSAELLAVLEQTPIALPAWDPLGALAQ